MLDEDLFAELVRQSFSLDLSGLVDEPELYVRAASVKTHEDGESVVEYREKEAVLAELESFVDEDVGEELEQLAYDENIAAWAEAVRGWILERQQADEVAFAELREGVGLSVVKVWLALLLGGFRLRQAGGFYGGVVVAF